MTRYDSLADSVHRHEDGRIAWSATLRFAIAQLVPFWDGAAGRAYTRREMRLLTRGYQP